MELVERRRAARYEIDLKGELVTAKQDVIDARIINLSFSGIQIKASTEFAHQLFPNLSREYPIDTVQFDLSIRLPKPFTPPHVRIGVVYLRRTSSLDMILGCRFEKFYDSSAEELASYLAVLKDISDLQS
ncbi:MAG: PilZ domain-containing protein [Gammaproteobacteria bacterium]|nr:PilZ domain-containing protein [Gammaproteobacteria bacterium]